MPFAAALVGFLYADEVDAACHGTMKDAANKILVEGFKIPAEPNAGHSLGPGVYFWEGEEAETSAFDWIFEHAIEGEISVLRSRLDLDTVLDLRDNDGIRAYNRLAEVLKAETNEENVSHAQVLAFAADIGLIDSTRAETLNKKPIVCVYDTGCIKDTCLITTL